MSFPFGSEIAPPDELLSRIRTAVATTPAQKIGTRRRIGLALAAVPFMAAAILLIASLLVYDRPSLRVDLRTHPTSQLLIDLLLVVGLALSATLVAVGRGDRGFGSGVVSLIAVALLVTPIYGLLTLAGLPEVAVTTVGPPGHLSPWGLRCLAIATAVGLAVLISFATALRGSAPVASRLRGAAIGAAAGAWAGLSVFVFCPGTEFLHLLVGHVLPIAGFTLVGFAAIPRILRP